MDNKFNIQDVVNINKNNLAIIKELHNGEIQAVCPRCGDKRGKFSISIKKGLFNCYHCDFKGNALSLQMELTGEIDPKVAAKTVYECISNDDYVPSTKTMIEEVEEVFKETDENISFVNWAILNHCSLKEEHKADLLRRGFTEEDIIKYHFKSVPSPEEAKEIVKQLIKEHYHLEGVPGFFVNSKGEWTMRLFFEETKGKYIPKTGYFCPAWDGSQYHNNKLPYIVGFQIRFDNPCNGGKYQWFSSNGKNKGVSSGAMATYLPGKGNAVIVAEGILKANLIYALCKGQITIIGVPGVSNYKKAAPYLKDVSFFFEAYDMDKVEKEKIKEEAKRLKSYYQERGILSHSLTWETDDKGLDDFLSQYSNVDLFISYLEAKTAIKKEMIKQII